MRVIIDVQQLIEALIPMSLERRGAYISRQTANIREKKCNEPWFKGKAPAKKTLSKIYSQAFETFWNAYPPRGGAKTGKMPAYQAWQQASLNEADLLQNCLTALAWQKHLPGWCKENGTYIPMASTYLNQRRWEDEQPDPTSGGYTDMDGVYHPG